MVKKKEYGPDVYKRLELVRKQFRRHAAEQKKLESAERKRRIQSYMKRYKINVGRTVVYIILAALVFSVIWVLVMK